MTTDELISHVHANYARIYLGGIPSTLNDDAAFLSFICTLTAVEALGGFLKPREKNGPRFKGFIVGYFPQEYHAHADALWKLSAEYHNVRRTKVRASARCSSTISTKQP
jgi:uroporphyrinogen-III decarboxylase